MTSSTLLKTPKTTACQPRPLRRLLATASPLATEESVMTATALLTSTLRNPEDRLRRPEPSPLRQCLLFRCLTATQPRELHKTLRPPLRPHRSRPGRSRTSRSIQAADQGTPLSRIGSLGSPGARVRRFSVTTRLGMMTMMTPTTTTTSRHLSLRGTVHPDFKLPCPV